VRQMSVRSADENSTSKNFTGAHDAMITVRTKLWWHRRARAFAIARFSTQPAVR
jgi:hypothetical protein